MEREREREGSNAFIIGRHLGESIRPQNHKPDKLIPRENRYLRGQQKAAPPLPAESYPRGRRTKIPVGLLLCRAPRGKREKESSRLDFPPAVYLISMAAELAFQWPARRYHAPRAARMPRCHFAVKFSDARESR